MSLNPFEIKKEINLSVLDDVVIPEQKKKEEEEQAKDTEKYIMHSKQIDTHTIKRTRIRLTPAVCDKCGLDLLNLAYNQNKVTTNIYEELSPEIQQIMIQLVERHKQEAHTSAENLIVIGKPKKWLSGRQV